MLEHRPEHLVGSCAVLDEKTILREFYSRLNSIDSTERFQFHRLNIFILHITKVRFIQLDSNSADFTGRTTWSVHALSVRCTREGLMWLWR